MSASAWSEQVLEGYFAPEQAEEYHNIPFEMPPQVIRLEVKYEYDREIGSDPHLTGGNTVDIGLFDQRGADYPGTGFRGWTGSARREFFITADAATPGYLAGPLDPGVWHVSLGFYKSAPEGCHYTVTLRFQHGTPAPASALPALLTLDRTSSPPPAHADAWYHGELHCHSYHSDGDSAPQELIDAAQALGLDFLAITDHNSLSHLADLATRDPGNLVLIPGCEVTTYQGHWNIWGNLDTWIDFRTLTPELMRRSVNRAVELGYLVSCNHPRRIGPDWVFQEVTGQHCLEVWNGPWHVFNSDSMTYWESRLRMGEHLTAVGGSDAHFLHKPHLAKIGTPTTWIYCPEPPTAANLLAALRAGHAFVTEAPDGPRLLLRSGSAMQGDTVERPVGGSLDVQAQVINGSGRNLELCAAGGVLAQRAVTSDDQTFAVALAVDQTPYIRAQLVDGNSANGEIHALTNPIYLTRQ